MTDVSLAAAFLAGLVSFLSPCVLPLVPGYISMLSGIGMEQLRAGQQPRPDRFRCVAQQLMAKLRRQIDANTGLNREFGVGFGLRHHDGKTACRQPCTGIFDDAAADGFVGTDEASLIERAGLPVAVVMGSPRNLKITTPGDMEMAEWIVNSG